MSAYGYAFSMAFVIHMALFSSLLFGASDIVRTRPKKPIEVLLQQVKKEPVMPVVEPEPIVPQAVLQKDKILPAEEKKVQPSYSKKEISEPSKPIFGISPTSVSDQGTFEVPAGNTLMMEPTPAVPVEEVQPMGVVAVENVDKMPRIINEVEAVYPARVRQLSIEGKVRIDIVITEEGRVEEPKLIDGPGYGLNEAALLAIKNFRFSPAIKNGKPVATRIVYTYNFILDDF